MSHSNALTETLTSREIEVLKLIATGFSTKEIGASLGIAFKTAACHRSRIMEKLAIHRVANLTRYAIRNGYVDAWEDNESRDQQQELFGRVRLTQARYQQALDEYNAFLRERETICLSNPRQFHRDATAAPGRRSGPSAIPGSAGCPEGFSAAAMTGPAPAGYSYLFQSVEIRSERDQRRYEFH